MNTVYTCCCALLFALQIINPFTLAVRNRNKQETGTLGKLTTIGEITIACALGYLDFRFANEPWRPGHPKLEAWYAAVVKLAPMAQTMPVG